MALSPSTVAVVPVAFTRTALTLISVPAAIEPLAPLVLPASSMKLTVPALHTSSAANGPAGSFVESLGVVATAPSYERVTTPAIALQSSTHPGRGQPEPLCQRAPEGERSSEAWNRPRNLDGVMHGHGCICLIVHARLAPVECVHFGDVRSTPRLP